MPRTKRKTVSEKLNTYVRKTENKAERLREEAERRCEMALVEEEIVRVTLPPIIDAISAKCEDLKIQMGISSLWVESNVPLKVSDAPNYPTAFASVTLSPSSPKNPVPSSKIEELFDFIFSNFSDQFIPENKIRTSYWKTPSSDRVKLSGSYISFYVPKK